MSLVKVNPDNLLSVHDICAEAMDLPKDLRVKLVSAEEVEKVQIGDQLFSLYLCGCH